MYSIDISNRIDEAVEVIRKHTAASPEIGIVLGTGLGGLARKIDVDVSIDYTGIPYFARSTVETHSGKLLFGSISGKTVVAMLGRFHYYEDYSMEQIAFPVRVMGRLGIKNLLISNACGSMNQRMYKGELVFIEDHINLMPDNPLRGINDESLGTRFVDMSEPWSSELIKKAEEIALRFGIKTHRGVYAAMPGPMLETRAEYRMLRIMGADIVGMSTVPENIAARQMGIEVFGISIITDECFPDKLEEVKIEEIIATAEEAEPALTKILSELISQL